MSEKYRVVLTCWDPGLPKPYEDDLSGVKLSLFSSKEEAQATIEECMKDELFSLNDLCTDSPREKEPIEDSDGNIVSYDYPFRGDTAGDHDGIVRFWDGDDYRNVTAYDIHKLTCDEEDLDKCTYYKYRQFWILPNRKHTSFSVEQFDTELYREKSLQDALRQIDAHLVELQYSSPAKTPVSRLSEKNSVVNNLIKAMVEYGMESCWCDSEIIDALTDLGITKQDFEKAGFGNFAKEYFNDSAEERPSLADQIKSAAVRSSAPQNNKESLSQDISIEL